MCAFEENDEAELDALDDEPDSVCGSVTVTNDALDPVTMVTVLLFLTI